ncbi:MAG TPA: hypothetical protein VGQ91_09215 [Ideonella sp.]|nr:hypothetical protein [Ideonella sp.]
MSLADLGIVAVILCNVLFLALCTYMAWRMLTHMRDTQADLSAFANSLKAHAGRLNRNAEDAVGVFGDIKLELGKLIETARGGLGGGRSRRDELADPYQQWAARDPKALNRLIDQQGNILDEVNKVDARNFDEWRRSKQVELERLLQQKRHVQQEFDRLRQAHDEATRKLREQELRGQQAQRAAAQAGNLRHELNDMRQLLQQAQARAHAAEQAAKAPASNAELSSSPAALAQLAKVKELAAQLAESDADRLRLRRQLEQIQDSLKRTLTEKEFIEDRFLALDADRPAAAEVEVTA